MADLKEVVTQRKEDAVRNPKRSKRTEASEERRAMRKLEKAMEQRLDDIAVENFDEQYTYAGDEFCKETNTKVKGFADLEKIYDWRDKMEKVLKRRLQKRQEKSIDMDYFSKKPEYRAKNKSQTRFNRESLELMEAMDKGKELSDNIEFQFARQFDDLGEMSTMVALTAGA